MSLNFLVEIQEIFQTITLKEATLKEAIFHSPSSYNL